MRNRLPLFLVCLGALTASQLLGAHWALAQTGLTQTTPLTPPVPLITPPKSDTTLPVEPKKPPVQAITLVDGQHLSLSMAFSPGEVGGPEYPPRGLSPKNPAYYPLQKDQGPLAITVQTSKANAVLVLRARSTAAAGQRPLAIQNLEYRVNGAAWLRTNAEQVIALLPTSGPAVYTVELRLRLTGEEPASISEYLLDWSIEGKT